MPPEWRERAVRPIRPDGPRWPIATPSSLTPSSPARFFGARFSGDGAASGLDGRRAWLVAVAAAAANFMAFGALFSFGVFLTPLADTFDTATGPVAALFSVAVCVYYASGAVAGRVADRWGVRPVVAAGAVAIPLGLALSARATALWQLYLSFAGLTGLGVGTCYSPLIGAVGRWFDRWRSLAMGVLLAGVGGGTLVVPIVCAAIERRYGWRVALTSLAVATAVTIGLATLAVARPPGSRDQVPTPPRALLASRRFRLLYLSVVLLGPGFYAPFAFYNDYARAQGASTSAAAALIGVSGGVSVVARLVFGWVGDRVGAMRQYRVAYLVLIGSLLVWWGAGGSYRALVISAGLHGLGWAAWVTATPSVLAGWFGPAGLGGVVGAFYTGLGLGALVGPSVSGVLVDRFGYRSAVAAVALTTVAAWAVTMAPMGDRSMTSVRGPRPDDA